MSNIRERRFDRFISAYSRLPAWLQILLLPWSIPARFLCYFPVLTPAVCFGTAGFIAYLKLRYLGEQLTWTQAGVMATGILWFPVLILYLAASLTIAGLVICLAPIYSWKILGRWRRGEPLRPLDVELWRKGERIAR